MRTSIIRLVILFRIIVVIAIAVAVVSPVYAKKTTPEEARRVAQNWVNLIIHSKGYWGAVKSATVGEVREFNTKGRKLGYFCRIEPTGYVLVSLHRGLAPVKTYSAINHPNPDDEKGMVRLLKDRMDRVLERVRQKIGDIEKAPRGALERSLDTDYSAAWNALDRDSVEFNSDLDNRTTQSDYSGGKVLMSSTWHQGWPYNAQCPPGDSCPHALVGCVATAGAQIMYYWNWPPYGSGAPCDDAYDWLNMRDDVTSSSPLQQIDAVAELSVEIGYSVGMDYGCDKSTAATYDMEGVYRDRYRYDSQVHSRDRNDHTQDEWWGFIVSQLNANRPIQYRVDNHSIVADGWQFSGLAQTRQYHMNYGWNSGDTAWYTLDELHLGGIDEEYMLLGIKPDGSMAPTISGNYPTVGIGYRYVDADATCPNSATIEGPQYVQFLPGAKLSCTSSTGGSLKFIHPSGSPYDARLFSGADSSKGIRLQGGALKLNNGGQLMFKRLGAPRYAHQVTYSSTSAVIGWEEGCGDQQGFAVERKTETGGTYTQVGTVTAAEHLYTDQPLVGGTHYYYRIRAFDSRGYSDYSNEVLVRTLY